MSRIAVVIGSTRPNRICGVVAAWALEGLAAQSHLQYELLDLAEINLPFLDEPVKPALHDYRHEHTRAWSERIQAFDGFVFVFPQYNWGYPAVLKNALDFLYAEWHDKPATVFSYGTRGGGKGAEQLRQVLQGLHMRVLEHGVQAAIGDAEVDDAGQLIAPAATLRPNLEVLNQIAAEFESILEDTQDSPAPHA